MMIMKLLLIILLLPIFVNCWVTPFVQNRIKPFVSTVSECPHREDTYQLRAYARNLAGCEQEEIEILKQLFQIVEKETGSNIKVTNLKMNEPPLAIPGTTGRILVLQTEQDDDVNDIVNSLCQLIDENLYSEKPTLKDPILISFVDDETNKYNNLQTIIEQEIEGYDLCNVIGTGSTIINNKLEEKNLVPSKVTLVDGAYIKQPYTENEDVPIWDTSAVIVFDSFITDDLRSRLLDIVRGENSKFWDDVRNGPDPMRWERGGLVDIPDMSCGTNQQNNTKEGVCWGLSIDATNDLCFESHGAILEMEDQICQLFPDFYVTRLPEAVLGAGVSPLTANAPTFGDRYQVHIDADPMLTPPSPWTDIFGRYPNRSKGKPRFITFLVYLNDAWDEAWGAQTKFLDVSSDTWCSVTPKPGRCLIMDQDVSHTVTAPNEKAGMRPRYSLVWKLILHPKTYMQDMRCLDSGRQWPQAECIGSAALSSI